ncbi:MULTISPECIES: 4-hydroxy-tetrahydrodipicolinate reductase [unclassified Diaminobutyricimonas]|uniref:4-hydroxy-tetrahydrodipicolinate reductase n=1 Tax=unclassified Diaminobutyricimonas TaxID=2643261 RepID=UPI0012F4EFC0|nr:MULTISPECIES: 4-hydroxy-tetrahydrodipicolinate reductase [unclassified Diaminobutyricimonas]
MTEKVAVVGATGRMGTLASRIIDDTDGFELVAQLGSSDDLDGILGADIVIDFTVPHVSPRVVEHAVSNNIPAVVGTSGWSAERIADLERTVAAHPELGVIIVPNFSLGSVLATAFAAKAARFYESIEIIEAHHESKIDSPSGTAVRTAELIGQARADAGPVIAPHADQRARGQQVSSVPIHSLRMQGVVAKQQVLLGGTGELLTITHDTLSQSAYEAGIKLALARVKDLRGVVVGLDALMDLDA